MAACAASPSSKTFVAKLACPTGYVASQLLAAITNCFIKIAVWVLLSLFFAAL
jgi:hypothetical protein